MLDVLIENFIPIIASIFGTVIVVLLRGLTKKYGGKLDIETKQRLDDLVASLTHQGVAYAEQWAKNRSKQLPEGQSVGGNEKLHKAMSFIADQITKNGLDHMAEKQLTEKIEAVLGLGALHQSLYPENTPQEDEDESLFS